jgi:manganese/zinc/iron transport system permease protein
MTPLLDALLLRAGYNTTLVTLGAALLGAAAGAIGTFVLLRRRSLASDAAGHAALPGLAAAFILMAVFTGDGRWLPGLMLGAALSAALGLVVVHTITARTRLKEDAAIGVVLSVFFGFGVVLLTVVQALPSGNQAGIASYLLGSAAGMLRSEAELIAGMAAVTALAVFLLRRPLSMLCFDPDYAAISGVRVKATDAALSVILLAVVITGLKVVGLVLSVALTIIPAVAARFWTDRVHHMVPVSAALGAGGAFVGAAISSSAPGLPTGAVIVLTMFAVFVVSLLFAPARGVLATAVRHQAFRKRVHRRQGLLALNRHETIHDGMTLTLLRRAGWIRRDGVATDAGQRAARAAARDDALWRLHRDRHPGDASSLHYHRIIPIADVLPADALADLEAELGLQGGWHAHAAPGRPRSAPRY